jgi:hypothetical protein
MGDRLEEDRTEAELTLSANLSSKPILRNGRLLRATEAVSDNMVTIKCS